MTLLVIKICDFVKDGRTRYVQGQPEREMRREKRARERQLMREQRREEKIRRLEDEIGDDEFSDDDDFLLDPSEAKKMKKGGFLEGTKLTGYSEEKPKKKDKLLKKKTDTAKMTAKTEENIDDSGDTDNTNEESADNTGKKQEETDGKYAGTPMNFEIHRAEDTVTDTYEADSEPQQEEEEELLPFPEEKVTRQPSKNSKSSEKEIQSGIVNIQHEITRQEAAVKKNINFRP